MSQPEIVQADLAGEDVVARVDLGGEDELFVTPTRTLLYRAEGLLSDESVEEYAHGAERITVSEGRRKAKVTLDYGLDGQKTISMPAKRLERAIKPILEGVLHANGVIEDDESIERLFRFSELTIVIAGERVVRHIGGNLWDEDFEAYHYDDVADLAFEDGSVATSVVLTVNGRQERFKAPNEDARAVRAALETTLLSYWDVDSVEELRAAAAPDEGSESEAEAEEEASGEEVSFGDGPDPLIADPAEPEELPENATRSADDGAADERAGSSETSPDALAKQVERPPASEASSGAERSADEQAAADDRTTANAQAFDTGSTSKEATSPAASGEEAGADAGTDASASGAPSRNPSTGDEAGEMVRGGSAEAGASTPEASGEAAEPDAGAGAGAAESFPPDPGFEGSGFRSAEPAADEQLREELAELREVVEAQNEELREQRELVEQLIEELRRGR